MKNIILFLSLCLIFDFTSGVQATNVRSNHQVDNISNLHHTASHLHGLAYQQANHVHHQDVVPINHNYENNHLNPSHLHESPSQQQLHSQNITIAQHQTNAINNKKNRSYLRGSKYPSYHHTTVGQHQTNPINNREVHPRFRPMIQNYPNDKSRSSLLKTTVIPSNSNLLDNKSVGNTTKSSSLLQIFTAKIIDHSSHTRRRVSFADYYYQQQLRAFFGHRHEKFPPSHTRSHIKTGLKR